MMFVTFSLFSVFLENICYFFQWWKVMEAKSALVASSMYSIIQPPPLSPNIPAQQSADSHDSRTVKHHRKHKILSRKRCENVSLSCVGKTLTSWGGKRRWHIHPLSKLLNSVYMWWWYLIFSKRQKNVYFSICGWYLACAPGRAC